MTCWRAAGGPTRSTGRVDFDLASYESSSAPVSVRLAGVNGDTQTALASGGDATGDKLSSIEGLIGSGGGDQLTGNSLDNLLAGGLGSDVLNGMNGTDTVDYSRDHFFDAGDTADRVEVHLGLGGANGTGDEFKLQGDGTFKRVSTDTLTSIENVNGTAGSDIIVGNELDNMLEGRGGSNVLDGGLGDDSLIGGSGIDTADYTSHDSMAVQRGEQYVIALGVIGRPGSFTLTSSPLPGVSQVVESDVLIGIENVTGSNHAEHHHRKRARQHARRPRRQRHHRRRVRRRHPDREWRDRHRELPQPRRPRWWLRCHLARQRHHRRKLHPLPGPGADTARCRNRCPA